MTLNLQQRIAKIAAPNVVELDLKRRAKFGKLNIAPNGFDLNRQIQVSTDRGDIRLHFARKFGRGVL